jgi:hypothetical protein
LTPLPDPIREEEVNIQLLDWTSDARTTAALERQAAAMRFESPAEYLNQLIAATLAGNESDTILADDGWILCRSEGEDKDGSPRNV